MFTGKKEEGGRNIRSFSLIKGAERKRLRCSVHFLLLLQLLCGEDMGMRKHLSRIERSLKVAEEGAFCLLDLTSRIATTTTTTEEDRGESDDGIHLCQSKSQFSRPHVRSLGVHRT